MASAQPKKHDPPAQPWLGPQEVIPRGGHKVSEVRLSCQMPVLPVLCLPENESFSSILSNLYYSVTFSVLKEKEESLRLLCFLFPVFMDIFFLSQCIRSQELPVRPMVVKCLNLPGPGLQFLCGFLLSLLHCHHLSDSMAASPAWYAGQSGTNPIILRHV